MKTLPCFSSGAPQCTGSLFAERQGVCSPTHSRELTVGNQETTR